MTAARTPARRRPRWSILLAAAMLCVFVALVLVWFSAAPDGNIHTGDSDNLVAGTRVAVHCIDRGTTTSCGLHRGTRNSSVGPYPLLQYLPATALVQLGLSNNDVLTDLGYLNILAFAGAVVLCLVAFNRRERRACRAIAVIAVLASSATYQSNAAFGEMLAATVTLAAVVAVMKRRTALIVVAAALAVLSKETFAPFVFALGLLAGRDEDDRWLPPKRVLVPLSIGVGIGTFATLGFNLFRFGTITNTFYFDPTFQTPVGTLPVKFFVGIWLSPAAGLAWYWPVATIVIALVGVAGVRRLVQHPREPLTWVPSLVLVLVAIGFTAGLALWFAPFGWIAYGPRLAVPLMPAIVVTALYLHAASVERIVGRITRRMIGVMALMIALVIMGWPQFGAAWSYQPAIQKLIAADATCPSFVDYSIEKGAGRYYACVNHRMWKQTDLPFAAAATKGSNTAWWARGLLALAVVMLLLDVRRRPTARPGLRSDADVRTDDLSDGPQPLILERIDGGPVPADGADAAVGSGAVLRSGSTLRGSEPMT